MASRHKRRFSPLLAAAIGAGAFAIAGNQARADEMVVVESTPETSPGEANYRRLRNLVHEGATYERASVAWGGAQNLVLGAGLEAFSIYAYADANDTPSKTFGVIGMVAGGLMMLGGTLALALNPGGTLAHIEENQATSSEDSARKRLAALEAALEKAANKDRASRRASGYFGIIFGVAAVIGTSVFFALDTKDTRTFRNTIAGAGWLIGATSTFNGIAQLGWRRTHVENTYNAWRLTKEEEPERPALQPPQPTGSIAVPFRF